MERFIKFNNEVVEAGELLHFERLARAWMNADNFTLSERQLIEMNPLEQTVAISVFWRHRPQDIQHAGRITDVLLLAQGFFRRFHLREYARFKEEIVDYPYPDLLEQLVFLLEEYRFGEQIQKSRPGTRKWFRAREKATIPYYWQQYNSLKKRGLLSDALLFYSAIALYDGTLQLEGDEEFEDVLPLLRMQNLSQSTSDSIDVAYGILYRMQNKLKDDTQLTHFQHLVLPGSVFENFTYHRGMKKDGKGSDQTKDSVEEMMQMWHQESEQEEGMHLRFEIEHGRDSELVDPEGAVEEGREDHDPTTIALGESGSTNREEYDKTLFIKVPRIHQAVTEIEKPVEINSSVNLSTIVRDRAEQAPYVKQLVTLFQKEMARKETEHLTGLSKGRLQKNLLPLWLEERPKLFYRKGQESKDLDAVFYLLLDGSASMQEKMDETNAAVLYVHDVLTKLAIPHRIVQHYEDAYDATDNYQPNYFEVVHEYDRQEDAAPAIYSLEAHEDNRDGYALRVAENSLLARPERQKFLVYFSDGEPSAFEYREQGIIDTADAVQAITKKGIAFLHLFLSDAPVSEEQRQLFETIYGNRTAATDSLDQFTAEAHRLLKRMLQQLLQVQG